MRGGREEPGMGGVWGAGGGGGSTSGGGRTAAGPAEVVGAADAGSGAAGSAAVVAAAVAGTTAGTDVVGSNGPEKVVAGAGNETRGAAATATDEAGGAPPAAVTDAIAVVSVAKGGSASLPVVPKVAASVGGSTAGVPPGVGGLPVEGGVFICNVDRLPEIGVEALLVPSLASLTANSPMSVSTVAVLASTVRNKG